MLAISIKQPFASLIAHGEKTIETRTWSTAHRGPLVIVASRSLYRPDPAYIATLSIVDAAVLHAECQALPLGQAIAICDIVDCRPMVEGDQDAAGCDFSTGLFSWMLSNVHLIDPFPVTGKQKLFTVQFPAAK